MSRDACPLSGQEMALYEECKKCRAQMDKAAAVRVFALLGSVTASWERYRRRRNDTGNGNI